MSKITDFDHDLGSKNCLDNITNGRINRIYSNNNNICDIRHFIKLPIEGHILSVLWIMIVGMGLDNELSENSFGNRLQSGCNIGFGEENSKNSKVLFKRYFDQYSIWKRKAFENAKKEIDNNHDVFILSMDIFEYYNSVNLDKDYIDSLCKSAIEVNPKAVITFLNDFIYEVITTYSKKFTIYNNRTILPVGFLPSNVIANHYLAQFDQAVFDLINPVYYGRYVDDIIIVDKLEYACNFYKNDYSNFENYIQQHYLNPVFTKHSCQDFSIKSEFLPSNNIRLLLNNKKFKIFRFEAKNVVYFNKFKSLLFSNGSEFRFLVEDELSVINDFEKVYSFSKNDSTDKFSSIDDVFVNKYELSKLLAKYSATSILIDDQNIIGFEKRLSMILTHEVILDNFLFWDKIVEILIINSRFLYLLNFCKLVNNAIHVLTCKTSPSENLILHKSLQFCLFVALCRNYPLVWSKERYLWQEKIFKTNFSKKSFDHLNIEVYDINDVIVHFAITHMIDNSVLFFVIGMYDITKLNKHLVAANDAGINLTKFSDSLSCLSRTWSYRDYSYCPFIIPDFVCSIYYFVKQLLYITLTKKPIYSLDDLFNYDNLLPAGYQDNVIFCNDYVIKKDHKIKSLLNNFKLVYFDVLSNKQDVFKIALANIEVDKNILDKSLKGKSHCSHSKYHNLSKIVNTALEQQADFLILPESCVPFDWLPSLARISARNNLAIITGVEYVVFGKYACNITAILLPYNKNDYSTAQIFFHVKNHYAPVEIEMIKGLGLQPITVSEEYEQYELYRWKGCYFCVGPITFVQKRS